MTTTTMTEAPAQNLKISGAALLAAEKAGLQLKEEDGALVLTDGRLSFGADLSRIQKRLKAGNLQQELLVRAAKIRNSEGPLTAVDATAGLAEDSFLLAAAGFQVQLYEKDPVIAALLRDALRLAAAVPELSEAAGRMTLCEEDSIPAMRALPFRPDVVLLDPMFPAREKSALIKKKFQLLQQLESPCADDAALLEAAITAHPHKIVIKRPLKGPFLADRKPDYSLKGKAIRYDCIVLV